MRRILLMLLLLAASAAEAQTRPPTVHDYRSQWDPRGWDRLGETTVQGGYDQDIIRVGRDEGAFEQLMVTVSGGALEMYDMTITFGNGERYSPGTRFNFRGSTATGAIDLPGRARGIRTIEFGYGNLGGRPRVEVWGKPAAHPLPPPPPPGPPPRPQPPPFDTRGWDRLGERTVDGRFDRDVLHVGLDEGAFSQLMLVAEGSDLDLYDMTVTFGNGERFDYPQRIRFREGQRTGAIDLPGRARGIRTIEFSYGNLRGGGRARLEVWGRTAAPQPAPPLPPPPSWDPHGWRLLGEATVAGRHDRDFIRVRGRARFRQLMVEVKGSALEMFDVVVYFRDGTRFSPDTRLYFDEGTRTRPIDLPGRARVRAIEFRYGNLPGGGRAFVRVWGR